MKKFFSLPLFFTFNIALFCQNNKREVVEKIEAKKNNFQNCKKNDKKNKIFKFKFYSLIFSIYIIFVGYANSVAENEVCVYSDLKTQKLIPSGQAVAMKLKTNGVLVVGVKNDDTLPAKRAGIKNGDIITMVNDTKVLNTAHFEEIIQAADENEITLFIKRDDKIYSTNIIPQKNNGFCEIGLWLRDSAAGIGTVSFYTSDKKHFYALGHPIADSDTQKNFSVRTGSLELVDIHGAKKGKKNNPGELIGTMSDYEIGSILTNTNSGIYGEIKDKGVILEKPIEVMKKDEVKEGDAYIFTTVSDCGVEKFEKKISKILDNNKNKDFIIKITDKKLIEKTGGIVQGMSGSPILQNGKIVGAVTHVFVNDPTRGYGIFIENMLSHTEN